MIAIEGEEGESVGKRRSVIALLPTPIIMHPHNERLGANLGPCPFQFFLKFLSFATSHWVFLEVMEISRPCCSPLCVSARIGHIPCTVPISYKLEWLRGHIHHPPRLNSSTSMPDSSSSGPPNPSSAPWVTVLIIVAVFIMVFIVLFALLRGALCLRGFVLQKQQQQLQLGGGRDVEAQHRGRSSSFDSASTSISQPLPLYPKPPSYKSRETLSCLAGADLTTMNHSPRQHP
ncbi:hypothetical protein F5I97DRAFT_1310873 [Phlebopus sp. FC_14]|nr:hypothetical protein F5I97DRAFT_1310873 [Phlebopus sp. FC_14]